MRDNFSNPNPFLGQVKNYQELVNQPTPSDRWADSLKQLGSQPANSRGQRSYNAVMQGFASGVQGAEDQRRQEKLSPIMEQAGQITAKAAELEAQSQQERGRKMTGVNFIKQSITRLMSLGEASAQGDVEMATGMAKEVGYEYQKAFGLKLGEFDHYDLKSRRIFYRNNDVVTGYSIPDTLREYATEAFGEQAPYVMRGLDPYFKNQYENTEMLQKLQLEKERSIANVNNAHAGNYNAQTEKTKHEMENPPKEKGTISPEKMTQDLKVLAEQIKKIGKNGEQNGFSRVMSEITPGHVYQLTPEQTQIDTLGQLMRGQMFKAFGYRNETEFEQIPTISSNHSVEQNEAIVKQYENLFLKTQQQDDSINTPKNNNDLSDLQ